MTPERMAPAHVYDRALGTGIEWTPETVMLWERGTVTETAAHTSASAWDFWFGLHYRAAFPMISHWWFRSMWTGEISVSMPDPAFVQEREVLGWITFGMLDAPRRPWSMTEEGTVQISVPYPPLQEQPINLPLRLIMGRAILGVIQGEYAADTALTVTSLVTRDELETYFPASQAEFARLWGGDWRLTHGDATLEAPRWAIGQLMGLEPPPA